MPVQCPWEQVPMTCAVIRQAVFLLTIVVALQSGLLSAAEPKWESLLSAIDSAKDAVVGQWKKTEDALTVTAAPGARLALPATPPAE